VVPVILGLIVDGQHHDAGDLGGVLRGPLLHVLGKRVEADGVVVDEVDVPWEGLSEIPDACFHSRLVFRKRMNKGVMATGTSRSARLVIRASARLVPAPYPQRCRRLRLYSGGFRRFLSACL